MRALIMALPATLLLAGCEGGEETQTNGAADQAFEEQILEANDVTAIDAATGADANMAADVEINVADADDDDEAGGDPPRAGATRSRPARDAAPADSDEDEAEAPARTETAEPTENSN